MVLNTLPEFGPDDVVNSAALYEHYTDRWARKDQWRVSMSRELRQAFCDVLAWTLLAGKMKDISYPEIRELIAATLSGDDVDETQMESYANDLQTCSFLVRGGQDEGYEFAHKSFTEFFTGRRIARALTEGSQLPEKEREEPAARWARARDSDRSSFPLSLSSNDSLFVFRNLLDVRLERAGAWSTFDFFGPEPIRGSSRESIGSQLERRVTALFDVDDASMARSKLPFDLTPEIATFALEWLQMQDVSFDLLVENAAGPGELKTLVELIKHGTAPDFFAANELSFTRHLRSSDDPQFSAALAGALVSTGYIKSSRIIAAMRDALTPKAFNYVAYVITEDGDETAMNALAEYAAAAEVDTLTAVIVTLGLRDDLSPDWYTEQIIQSIRDLAAEGEDAELVAALAESTAQSSEELYDIVEAVVVASSSVETQMQAVKLLDGVTYEKAERRLRRMWVREEVSEQARKVLQQLEHRFRSTAASEKDRRRWGAHRGQVRESLWRSLQP